MSLRETWEFGSGKKARRLSFRSLIVEGLEKRHLMTVQHVLVSLPDAQTEEVSQPSAEVSTDASVVIVLGHSATLAAVDNVFALPFDASDQPPTVQQSTQPLPVDVSVANHTALLAVLSFMTPVPAPTNQSPQAAVLADSIGLGEGEVLACGPAMLCWNPTPTPTPTPTTIDCSLWYGPCTPTPTPTPTPIDCSPWYGPCTDIECTAS